MRYLTLDIGNSFIKKEIWDSNSPVVHESLPNLFIEEVLEDVNKYGIDCIIISSVNQKHKDLIKELKENSTCPVKVFDSEYLKREASLQEYKGNLGADRAAAFWGARSQYKDGAILIIDAGTALTIDVGDSHGIYRGGCISLGLYSRLKALAGATTLLPELKDLKEYVSFGNDTVSSIEAGAINGILGEILFAAERAKAEYDIKRIFFTGGDGRTLFNLLKDRLPINSLYDPHLVGRGLVTQLNSSLALSIEPAEN